MTVLDERKSGENFLRAGFPTDRKPYTSDYDYEDDSDLDDDAPDQDDERGVVPQDVAGKLGNNIKLAAAKSETSDESLDIISVSDPKPPDTPNPNSSLHAVKVVVIEDVAFVT